MGIDREMNAFVSRFFSRSAALAVGGLLAALFAVAPATGTAQQAVAVVVNGQAMSFDQPPIIQAGRVFVPLRSIFQQLGASVVYSNGQINATGRGRTVSLTIGSTQATVSGQPVTMDVAPFVIGSRTLVPLRFVAQSLGANVNWDDSTSTVTINSNGENRPIRVAQANSENFVSQPPPPLPEYQQPYAPAPNYLWTPGYWAWGSSGFFWVPGTWVQAPQSGLYWTPGYWGQNGSGYAWNAGYWAPQVGFYGGVNYGFGYFGDGYQGGRWGNNGFAYNTAYSNVNRTIVTNTYVNNTIVNTTVINRVSYNGGSGGVRAQPTAQQLALRNQHHVAMTPVQVKHVESASQDRDLYASVNHGKPALPAVPKPLSTPPARDATPPPAPRETTRPAPAPRETTRPAPAPRETTRPAPAPRETTRPAPVAPATKPPVRVEPLATAKPEPRATVRPEPRATVKPIPLATAKPEPRATVKPEAPATPKPEEKPATEARPKPTEKPTEPPPPR
jgi:hypothetical protein